MKQKIITSIWQVLRVLVWYYLKRVKKLILTKIEDLQYIELNALPVYGGIYLKTK